MDALPGDLVAVTAMEGPPTPRSIVGAGVAAPPRGPEEAPVVPPDAGVASFEVAAGVDVPAGVAMIPTTGVRGSGVVQE